MGDYGGVPRRAYVALTTDVKFICSARQAAREAAAHGPVFRYSFTQALMGDARLTPLGAWHGLELLFVFQHLRLGGYVPTAGEVALAGSMARYWTQVGAAGDPNFQDLPAWPRYDAARDTYLQLGEVITAKEALRGKQCDFWDQLIAAL